MTPRPITAADVRLEVAAASAKPREQLERDIERAVARVRADRRRLHESGLFLARLVDRVAGAHGEAFALQAAGMTEAELLDLLKAPLGLENA